MLYNEIHKTVPDYLLVSFDEQIAAIAYVEK